MVSRRFRYFLGLLLLALSSPAWAQVIHWELNGEIVAPGTSESQERAFSGGFDFDTLTGNFFNVSIFTISTTGQSCFLCFDYSGSTAMVYNDGSGGLGAEFRERVGGPPAPYRENYLGIFGFDVYQPGTFSNLNLEEHAYFNAGTGDPVDDTFIADSCAGCATLIGTLAPIPEPETYAMLLVGLGLLGFRSRNSQRNALLPCGGHHAYLR